MQLPARPRLRPVPRRADRLELRHGGGAREPVPEPRRQRDDGRRRAVDHQRRLLQHVVPGVPDVDRAATTSSATTSPIPPQGRTGDNCLLATKVMVPLDGQDPRGRGPARLAQLRDPADGRAGQPTSTLQSGERAAPPAGRQEPAQPASPSGCSCSCAGCYVFAGHAARLGRLRPVRPGRRTWVVAVASVVSLLFTFGLLRAASSARSAGLRRAASRGGCSIYDRALLAARAALEGRRDGYLTALQRHPVQEPALAAAGRPDRPPGLRRRLLLTERTLTTIGDDCTLNAGSIVQCHSQEDGAFKSDRIAIGAGVHARGRRLRPLRRDDRRRRGARRRLLPDEGRGGAAARPLGREPGQGDAETRRTAGRPARRRATGTPHAR